MFIASDEPAIVDNDTAIGCSWPTLPEASFMRHWTKPDRDRPSRCPAPSQSGRQCGRSEASLRNRRRRSIAASPLLAAIPAFQQMRRAAGQAATDNGIGLAAPEALL